MREPHGKPTVWVRGAQARQHLPVGGGMYLLLLHAIMEMTGFLGVPALLPPAVSFSDLWHQTPGSRDLRMLPETTTEAPVLPPNLHGAWPTTIL